MPPQPSRRETARRAAILAAATQLFLEHGYAHTTMDMIAKAARVTKQTVYAYFPDKNTLFEQMIVGLCERYVSAEALTLPKQPLKLQLFTIGMALADLFTHPDVIAATRLVIAESQHHPKLAQLYYESGTQRVVAALSMFLQQQNDTGALRITNTASAASHFFALLKGQYYLRMMLGAKPFPARREKEQHIHEAVEIFLRVYAGSSPLNTRSAL